MSVLERILADKRAEVAAQTVGGSVAGNCRRAVRTHLPRAGSPTHSAIPPIRLR